MGEVRSVKSPKTRVVKGFISFSKEEFSHLFPTLSAGDLHGEYKDRIGLGFKQISEGVSVECITPDQFLGSFNRIHLKLPKDPSGPAAFVVANREVARIVQQYNKAVIIANKIIFTK